MKRKLADEQRYQYRVPVRLTNDEFQQVSQLAEKLHMSKAAVFRFGVFNSKAKARWLKNLDKRPKEEFDVNDNNRQAILDLTAELNKIGTNVNQIAHKANRTDNVLPETKQVLKQTINELNKVLRVLGCHT